jgi:hypothetical protein
MKKLLLTLFTLIFSLMLFAQENLYADSKIKVQFSVEQHKDPVNDYFHEYYAFKITNTSQNQVSFIPVFKYVTDTGEQLSSAKRDENSLILLAPGESIVGDLVNHKNLTLFKQFLVGNSSKRSSESTYTIKSATINYQ